MSLPVGILGGTFDPVHHGHLRLALECIQAAGLAEVNLVPLHAPAHRGPVTASATQRLDMLRLATANMAQLHVDDMEIRRGGTSWSIDTVSEYRRKLGNRPICLIMGMDAFQGLHGWKQWDLIPGLVHIIVAARPDTEPVFENKQIADLYTASHTDNVADIHSTPAGRILKINIPLLSISSTRIRSLLAAGQGADFLLPQTVLSYIYKEKIYLKQT
jgi:nicotinate-nucleotide adenylyltransferase